MHFGFPFNRDSKPLPISLCHSVTNWWLSARFVCPSHCYSKWQFREIIAHLSLEAAIPEALIGKRPSLIFRHRFGPVYFIISGFSFWFSKNYFHLLLINIRSGFLTVSIATILFGVTTSYRTPLNHFPSILRRRIRRFWMLYVCTSWFAVRTIRWCGSKRN